MLARKKAFRKRFILVSKLPKSFTLTMSTLKIHLWSKFLLKILMILRKALKLKSTGLLDRSLNVTTSFLCSSVLRLKKSANTLERKIQQESKKELKTVSSGATLQQRTLQSARITIQGSSTKLWCKSAGQTCIKKCLENFQSKTLQISRTIRLLLWLKKSSRFNHQARKINRKWVRAGQRENEKCLMDFIYLFWCMGTKQPVLTCKK